MTKGNSARYICRVYGILRLLKAYVKLEEGAANGTKLKCVPFRMKICYSILKIILILSIRKKNNLQAQFNSKIKFHLLKALLIKRLFN